MIAGDALLDAFINANVLFVVGYGLWWLALGLMRAAGLQHAHATQLKLLNFVFLAILCAPFIDLAFRALQDSGVGRDVNINLSDMIVAHYLNGGLAMKASEFERLVLSRDTFTLNLLTADGMVAQTVIALFLSGLLYGYARLGLSAAYLVRIVRHSYAWRRMGRIHIRLSDRTLVPFSTKGVGGYYVILPSHLLAKQDELNVALAHEFQHIRQGDLEWELLLEILKPAFFFNPAYRAWKRQVEHLRELTCDSRVLSSGRMNRRVYCETLLSICQKTLQRDKAFVLAVPKVTMVTADRASFFPKQRSFLERRIVSALEMKTPRPQRLTFALFAVPLMASVMLLSLAIQSPGDWSQDRLMLSTVVNLDRLDEINRLSAFGRVRN